MGRQDPKIPLSYFFFCASVSGKGSVQQTTMTLSRRTRRSAGPAGDTDVKSPSEKKVSLKLARIMCFRRRKSCVAPAHENGSISPSTRQSDRVGHGDIEAVLKVGPEIMGNYAVQLGASHKNRCVPDEDFVKLIPELCSLLRRNMKTTLILEPELSRIYAVLGSDSEKNLCFFHEKYVEFRFLGMPLSPHRQQKGGVLLTV